MWQAVMFGAGGTAVVALAMAVLAGSVEPAEDAAPPPPALPAAGAAVPALAEVEDRLPLDAGARAAIGPATLRGMDREQLEQLYARLEAGPLPQGEWQGEILAADALAARLAEVFGGASPDEGDRLARLEQVLRAVAGHRLFEEGTARSALSDAARETLAEPTLLATREVTRAGLLALLVPTEESAVAFPARLHCGQSLLDARRESLVIDHRDNASLPDWQDTPDSLAGGDGLALREEMRLVRPGLYLGRAYARNAFLFHFALSGPAEGGGAAGRCWPGGRGEAAR